MDIKDEIASLRKMTVKDLQQKHVELFGEPTRSCNRQWLFRRLAWRVQALVEGDITQRARERARQLTREADLRIRPPHELKMPAAIGLRAVPSTFKIPKDDRLPMPGAVITRNFKGHFFHVNVLTKGFEFDGELYKSLSAIAHKITGTHWNGYDFFRLGKRSTE
ncbi:MAG: DUF2924 domain-containing protein [Phycisphaerales bacterium]